MSSLGKKGGAADMNSLTAVANMEELSIDSQRSYVLLFQFSET